MKQTLKRAAALLLALCMLTAIGCAHTHVWQEASCETAFHCTECGETSGEPLGHTWTGGARCLDKIVCSTCGKETENTTGAHRWVEATCETPKTCSDCGATEGEPKGHFWRSATCETPQKCDRCGLTKGEARGHMPTAATCTQKSVCSICGDVRGTALGHSWAGATCTQNSTCTRCGAMGNKAEHTFVGQPTCGKQRQCTACGYKEAMLEHSFGAGGRCTRCNKSITTEELAKLVQFRVEILRGVWTDTGDVAEFMFITCINRTPYTVYQYDYEPSRVLTEMDYTWASIDVEANNGGPTWTQHYMSALNGTDPMRSARLITPYSYQGDHLQSFCIGMEVPRDVIVYEWIRINGRNYCVKLEVGKDPVWIE